MGLHYGIGTQEAVEASVTYEFRPEKMGEATGHRRVQVWTGYWDAMVAMASSATGGGSEHVVSEVTRLEDGLAELRVTYERVKLQTDEGEGGNEGGDLNEGVETDGSNDDLGSEDNPTYSSSSSTYEASILTHPKFKDIGSPGLDALKACIDGSQLSDPLTVGGKTGKVEDFLTGKARTVYDKFISRGVVAYLEVSTECTCRFRGRSSRYTPGQIAHPPGGIRTPAGRNWLCTGAGIEMSGKEVWSTASFRLSGPEGWDQDLYG